MTQTKNNTRPRIIFFIVLILLAAIFISTKTIFAKDLGPHGGRVEKAETHNIEVKTDYNHFYAFLLTTTNEPISNKNITCDIRYYLLDGSNLDMPLKPFGDDAFSIDYLAHNYNSFKITFQVDGKPVSAKFENDNVLVKEGE